MKREPESLVVEAFKAAKESGKSDWTSMTIAVLKNRLLGLTGGDFSQSQYGARTMKDFASQLSETIVLDTTTKPPVVTLKNPELILVDNSIAVVPRKRERIREDLWRSFLDFSSGSKYVWDASTSQAVRSDLPNDDRPRIPTITIEEYKELRRSFLETLSIDDKKTVANLPNWASAVLSDKVLSHDMRNRWNGFVKKDLTQRISDFFRANHLDMPYRLTKPLEREIDAEFRKFVIKCVQSMPLRDLKSLQLPAMTAFLAARSNRMS